MKLRYSLLFRIYLSTAFALTVLFASTVWFVQREAVSVLRAGVEEEARANLSSADALWRSRADLLATLSASIASMSDVRAAFGTRDRATIRDTAGEFWTHIVSGRADPETAAFVVTDPLGEVIVSLGKTHPPELQNGKRLSTELLYPALKRFPKQMPSFVLWDGAVWQTILTPVYVDSGSGKALLNILLAAYPLREETLRSLRKDTGGDYLLRIGGKTAVSTMPAAEAESVAAKPEGYAIHHTDLQDASGKPIGEFLAVRSFAGVQARAEQLRRTILAAWLAAMAAGLALSYYLARKITEPLRILNSAAQELSRENYSVRVPEGSPDELGVLARTFNRMSASIESSRADQIRREQINAIGRLAASVAHDLRNPLSAVLGGAEMIAEFDLPPKQLAQTAQHVHSAAKRMENLLSELGQVARARTEERTECLLEDLVNAALDSQRAKAEAQGVDFHLTAEPLLKAPCERKRIERVLVNLISNALEVMPKGGELKVTVFKNETKAHVVVSDTGPGVPDEIREHMFQPFVTSGKKNGLGLGLALARQTLLDHGGDLELLESQRGARFQVTLPLSS